jgi:putative glutamine amidotransferase
MMRVAVTYSNEARLGPYLVALEKVGIEPELNPPSLDSLDGLLLSGGSDINPARYGQSNTGSDEVNDARDELELRLVREALENDIPVLAICRGLQVFNVARGGTLIQHLPSTNVHRQKPGPAEPGKHPVAHRVQVKSDTRLAEIVGAGELEVNSRHHQAAAEPVAAGLIVSAWSEDGVIEGLEDPSVSFAVAVQWHPEDRILVSEADRKLFEAFAGAIARSMAGHRAVRLPSW